jgi:O-antigen/teichoic acid export membrane protein
LLIGVAARYSTNTMTVVMLVGLAKALDSLSDLMYGLLQRNNMIRCVAQSRIAQGSIQLVSFYLLLRNTGDLPLALVGSTFGLGLVFLLFDLRNARLALKVQAPDGGKTSMVPSYSPPILKKIAALSLPLGLIYFFDTLIINVPRYGLDHFQGRDAVGYYSALAYLIVAGTTVVTAMAEASRTRLALAYVKSASTYFGQVRKLLVLAGGIGLLGCIFSWTLGPWMLAVVYRKDYAAYGYVLNLLMVSAALWYVAIFLAAALTSARQFASQVPLFAVGAIATGIGTWVLVPTHGLAGAALALGAGMLVRIGGGALQLGRVLRNAPQAAPASGPNPT